MQRAIAENPYEAPEPQTDAEPPPRKEKNITESSHYEELVQLIDTRWEQKQAESAKRRKARN